MSGRDGAYEWQTAFRKAEKPTLSSAAYGVLLDLSLYANKRDGASARPSAITLAKDCGASYKTVLKALSEGERLGWIVQTGTYGNQVKVWKLTIPSTDAGSTATAPGTDEQADDDDAPFTEGGVELSQTGYAPFTEGYAPFTEGYAPFTEGGMELSHTTSAPTSAPTSPVSTSPVSTSPVSTSPEPELEAEWFDSHEDDWRGIPGVSEPDYGWAGPRERPQPTETGEPKPFKPSWSRG